LSEINQTAKSRVSGAGDELRRLAYILFGLAVVLIVLVFGLALAYRALGRRAASATTSGTAS
jgi:uncharacterized membrane protein YuzA (DUF378 family)